MGQYRPKKWLPNWSKAILDNLISACSVTQKSGRYRVRRRAVLRQANDNIVPAWLPGFCSDRSKEMPCISSIQAEYKLSKTVKVVTISGALDCFCGLQSCTIRYLFISPFKKPPPNQNPTLVAKTTPFSNNIRVVA